MANLGDLNLALKNPSSGKEVDYEMGCFKLLKVNLLKFNYKIIFQLTLQLNLYYTYTYYKTKLKFNINKNNKGCTLLLIILTANIW